MTAEPVDPADAGLAAAGTSSMSSAAACRPCGDTGVMRWLQAVLIEGGGFEQREMTHPCTCQAARDAGVWRHPAAEADRVVGQAAAAQQVPPGLAALLAALTPGDTNPT